ncbi:hypothetical protein AAG906_005393 [Vitis piasezkii]
MCGGDFMSKNPEEAMDFLSYVAEVSRGWDEPTKGEVGKMKSQLNAYNAKAGMYTLKEDDDMKAKMAAMTRRLEELELKRIHEVQVVAEAPVQVKLCPNCQSYEHLIKQMLLDNSGPITMCLMEILTILVGGIIQISHGRPEQLNTNSRIHHLNNLQPHVEKEEEIKKGKEMEDKESEISEEKKDSDSTMKAIPEKELLKEEMLKKSTSPPFPQALHGKKGIRNAAEILEVLRQVKVNIPLLDMIKQVPTYAKFLKDLCTIKRGLTVNKKAFLTEQVSAILQCKSPLKYKDPGSPTISVMIGGKVVEKALLDLGASVNLLPYTVYKQLGLGELKPTTITLSLADRSVKIPRGVIEDVLVQVDNFYYPVDFIVLDTDPTVKEANLVPIILGRPFLATSNAIINCGMGLSNHSEEEEGPEELCIIDTLVEERCNQNMQDKLNESLVDFEEAKPIRQFQRRLNPHLQEVVRAEVLKLLQAGIIYPISDSPWVSPTQVVPKKSGITVVQNEKGEEITTRLTSGWRVCIDYRKLNAVTRKDHFPLPFIDQVLERVSGHPFYCFLDGYSGYFQIEIDLADQEKTTFTCPFGTYAYRRMPFGLCNAPATFQRCMLSIFSDMVERIMEVFMDDIIVYGGTFEECLVNLEAVLHRCIEKDLVLNWEKCHFMVELIVKLQSPTSVKGVRQFLGHAGAVLGQREDGKLYVIYYASKTLNEAQRNYTTIEKELLAVIFALDKFRAYLVGSFIIVFLDHSALKYLLQSKMQKQVTGEIPSEWNAQDRKHFFAKIHAYYWEEPFLFKYCADQIIRKCVPEDEQQGILSHCHENACGGHFASQKTAMKVLQSGFTWPSLFKDAHIMSRSCDRCQRLGKLTKRNQMPMNPILIVELFDVWGIDFMGPFPMSFGNSYILVVLKFLKENIFSRFGVPKAIIDDGSAHFYGVKHKVATPYHPQTSGQVELANREIKNILMKVVNSNRKDWSIRLHNSLWAYRTTYKTILRMSPIVLSMVKHVISCGS